MSLFVVDVESDGPAPGLFSMVSFGIVKVDANDPALNTTFFGQTAPISQKWVPEALAISEISREIHLSYPEPSIAIKDSVQFIRENSEGRPIFLSDNLAFDWSFMNYYYHLYIDDNPFGFSGRRIGDIYSGIQKNLFKASEWKKFRQTKHTHNPVDDAKGNVEAFIYFCRQNSIKIPK
jgi:hypothetical protein